MAKKIEHNQFALPFPIFGLTIDKFFSNIAQRMDILWKHPNKGCQLDYSNITATNSPSQWILTDVRSEKEGVENDLMKLQQELTELFISTVTEHQHREQKGVPVALRVGAPAEIFSLGIGFKDKLSFTLGQKFGGCNQIGKKNRKAILDTITHKKQIRQE